VYVEEIAKGEYCDPSPWFCGCVGGKRYYGRGPIQLSWNYNYCRASEFLFGNAATLQQDPDLVARDPKVAWATALWFWMTQTGAGSMTAHSAMVNGSGFGETIRTINGGLECNGANPATVSLRIQYYQEITGLIGVSPGSNLGC
jgi:chitinase